MIARIQVRRDSESNWTANNPILTLGEIGYDTDTEKFKVGISSTSRWNDLPYQLGQWDSDASGNISYGYASHGPTEGNVSIKNDLFVDGSLTVLQDLTVKGTTATINTVDSTFKDVMIQLNYNVDDNVNGGPYLNTLKSGFEVNRGNVTNIGQSSQQIYWHEDLFGAGSNSGVLPNGGAWVIDSDLNVIGDIYSNSKPLWRLNGDDIYYKTGYVGIGLDNPSSILHIKDVSPVITLEDDGDPVNTWEIGHVSSNFFINTLAATDGSMFTILDGGNVGIGTSNPDELLHLEQLTDGSNKGNPGIVLGNSDQKWTIFNRGFDLDKFKLVDVNADTSPFIVEKASPTDSLYIKSNGSVGIGTNNPSSKLEIESGSILTAIDMLSCKFTNTSREVFLVKSDGTTEIDANINQPVSHVFKISNTLGSSISGENGSTLLKLKHDISDDVNFYQYYSSLGGVSGINFGLGVSNSQDGSSSISFTNSSTDSEILFRTSNNNRVLIDTDGNVGIGTTNPLKKLHVRYDSLPEPDTSAISSSTSAVISGIDGGLELLSADDNTTVANFIGLGRYSQVDGSIIHKFGIVHECNTGSQGSNTGHSLSFTYGTGANSYGNTELLTILSGGNVGIGTAPSQKLHVAGAIRSDTLDLGKVLVSDSTNKDIKSSSITTTELGHLSGVSSNIQTQIGNIVSSQWVTSNNDIYYNTGNVGINALSPATKLNIESNTAIGNETLLRLQRSSGFGNTGFNQYYNSASSPNPILWGLNFGLEVSSDTDGKVGIKFESTSGTTTTSDKIIFRTANTNQVDIDDSGNLTATGTITSSSDITLKENIELISNPIEKVKELSGYTFNKKGEDVRLVGLIAQEVEKVLPEAVHENQEGLKSLAYGNLVALLVECVKKQDERIESLERTIEEMK